MTDGGDASAWSATRSSTPTGPTASTTTTPKTPTAWSTLGKTAHGEVVEINRRAAESDLRHLREHQLRADGRRPQVGRRRPVRLRVRCKAHHTPKTIRDIDSYMDPPQLGAAPLGRAHRPRRSTSTSRSSTSRRCSTTAMFDGPLDFLMKNEDDFTESDRLKFQAMQWTLVKLPRAGAAEDLHARAGAVRGDRRATPARPSRRTSRRSRRLDEQYCVAGRGAGRHRRSSAIPYISPYNVNSILNPLLVQVMALGYFFNMYRGEPLVQEGRRDDRHPPVLRPVRSGAPPAATSSSSTGSCPRRATR